LRLLKLLVAAIVGFLAATALVGLLWLAAGSTADAAVLGGIQIILWLLITAVAYRRTALHPRANRVPADESPVSVSLAEREGDAERPPVGNGQLSTGKRVSAPGWVALAIAGLIAVFGVGLGGGYLGARLAMPAATTTSTTSTTTPPTIESAEDLTDAERVWCKRDRESIIAVAKAASTLEYWDFDANLYDPDVPGDDLVADWERWILSDGYTRGYALACQAAFAAR